MFRKALALLVLTLLMPMAFVAQEAPAEPASLELNGMVFGPNGAPLEGIRVVAVEAPPKKQMSTGQLRPVLSEEGRLAETRSDEAGSFFLELDPEQNFFLLALQDGFFAARQGPFGPDHESSFDPTSRALELKFKEGFSASGAVLDGPGGKPLSGVRVLAFPVSLNEVIGAYTPPALFAQEARTDSQGKYRLDNLAAETFRLVFKREDRATRTMRRHLTDGQEIPAVSLQEGSRLSGQVKDHNGKPVAGAVVGYSPRDKRDRSFIAFGSTGSWAEVYRVRSDENGRYEITGLPLGDGVGYCHAQAFGMDSKDEVTLSGPGGAVWNPSMKSRATVTLKVVLEGTEEPLAEVRAAIFNTPKPMPFVEESSMEGISDAKGLIRIENVESGNHFLHLYPVNSQAPKPLGFNVGENDRKRDLGVVVLKKGQSITGQVLDQDGEGVAKATVRTNVGVFKSTRTKEDGTFVLGGLEEGELDLWVDAEGFITKDFTAQVPGTDPVKVTLTRNAVLKVRILVAQGRDEDPVPAKRALVGVYPADQEGSNPWDFFSGAARHELDPKDNGWFELDGMKPGSYHLEFVLPDGKPNLVKDQSFEAGRTTTVEEQVLSLGRSLKGRVLDASTRLPVEGAILLGISGNLMEAARGLYSQSGDEPPTSDSYGKFFIGGLPEEGGTLVVRHPDYAPRTVALDGLDPQAPELEVLLQQGGALYGTVEGLDPETEYAMVALRNEGEMFNFMSMGGTLYSEIKDNQYRIEHIPAGTYRVMINTAGGMTNLETVTIEDQGEHEYNINLQEDQITGVVRLAGQPLPQAQVLFFPAQATQMEMGMSMKQAMTDEEGRFTINGLDPEVAYQPVVIRQAGFAAMINVAPVASPPMADAEWAIDLGASKIEVSLADVAEDAQVNVMVLTPDPNAAASVFNQVPGYRTVAQTNTTGGQTVSLDGLEAGTYTIMAQTGTLKAEVPEVVTDSGTPVDISFGGTMTVKVAVQSGQGQPIQGAMVLLMGPAGEGPMAGLGMTDITGEVTSSEVGEGAYSMWAIALGQGMSAPLQVDFSGQSSAEETLVIPIAGSIEVTVEDGSGQPMEGQMVQVQIDGIDATALLAGMGQVMGGSSTTDANGLATLRGLPPGNYRLSVQGPLGAIETSIMLGTGDHKTVTLAP